MSNIHRLHQTVRELDMKFPTFESRPIYDSQGNEIKSHKAITNIEDGSVKSILSKKFALLNHDKAFEMIDKTLGQFAPEVEPTVQFRKDGAVMKVSYDLPEQYDINLFTDDGKDGDRIRTKLVGLNSVDGSTKLMFNTDFERMICSNGMYGWTTGFSFTRKHTRMIEMEDVVTFDIAAKVRKAIETVHANANLFEGTSLNFNKGLELIKGMVDLRLFPKKMEPFIKDFWTNAANNKHSAGLENGANLWTLYNAVTAAATHSTNSKGEGIAEHSQEYIGKTVTNFMIKLAAEAA